MERYKVRPYEEEGTTMSTEEYLKKKEQEEIDRLFDEAIAKAKAEEKAYLESKERNEYISGLCSSINDAECELGVAESQLSLWMRSSTESEQKEEKVKMWKEEVKKQKTRLTKLKKELERCV